MKNATKKTAEAKATDANADPRRAEMKRLKDADRAKRKAAAPKASAKPATKKAATATKANSKGATILALIQREGGATATELQQATGWQAHSVRGFLSTTNKRGTKIASAKREDGQRVYSAA